MSQFIKILAIAFTSGFLSALALEIFAIIGFYLFLRNLEIAFLSSADPLTPFDGVLIILCLLLILLTLAICPYIAYKIRNVIFEASPLASIRVLLFSLVASAQIIFLVLGAFFVLPTAREKLKKLDEKPDLQIQRREIKEKINKELAKADIEIVCKRAKIIHFSERNLVGEFILQIKGVPDILSFYSFQIPIVNENNGFKVGNYQTYSSGGHSLMVRPLNISAIKTDGKWLFYGGENQKTLLGNDDEFTVRLEFYRENPQDTSYPETITPELKISPIPLSDFSEQRIIFSKPIPVSFGYY